MRPRCILAATDFSEHAERAVGAAAALAERYGAKLHLIHALEVPLPIFEPYAVAVPADFVADARKAAQAKLDATSAGLKKRGIQGSAYLGEVPAAPSIAHRAEAIGADLIVIGTRGNTGLKHILLGSVAERTVKEAPCSVLTVKGDEPVGLPKIIAVGVDFSDAGNQALEAARELAKECGAALHLVHALDLRIPFVTPYEVSVPDPLIDSARNAAKEKLDALVKETSAWAKAEPHVISAPPHAALCEAAERLGADLIVTGSRGLSGLKHVVLGSVAERTLRHAACSVLTIRDGAE